MVSSPRLVIALIPLFFFFIEPAPAVPEVGSPEELGEYLLKDNGCVGCHAIAETDWGKNGTSLRHIGEKVNADWLVAWLSDPRDYLPQNRMPLFGLDEEQALAVAAFLLEASTPTGMITGGSIEGDPKNGEWLVAEVGCLGCHSLQPKGEDQGPTHGPNLSEIGSKTDVGWLYHWLLDPTSHHPETRMPNLRLTEQEAADIAVYLSGLGSDRRYEEAVFPKGDALQQLVSEGETLVDEKGCYGCHDIAGFEESDRLGSDLEDWEPADFTWLHQTGEEEDLLVPQFSLSEEDLAAMATAAGTAMPQQGEETEIAHGRLLIRRYNCIGCHQVERLGESDYWGGDIRATIEDRGYYPPPLHGEGAKVQTDWLTGYLPEVTTVRPWLKARMPSFFWREGEVEALVRYFKAMDSVPLEEKPPAPSSFTDLGIEAGMMLFKGFQCISCHPVNQAMIDAIPDKANLAPNLSLVPERLRYDWLYHWILEPQDLSPGTRMPDNFPDMGEQKNASLAFRLINAPQNSELKTWFEEHYEAEELKRNLEDTEWVIDRMRDHLWNFDAEEYLNRFPWSPPTFPEEEAQEE